ncbi:ABC transporter permease [Fundicoccus culcitae]|uniref:Iron ABC transporter permease n=1 Tax=Fundicoccus culcitae TaxID=2969821 RepID=A0ABY5P3T2_9LACT|nr:iron ABC transporter permease [Fundicoccus culcitae]UUX33366.1 iron ABC transporter permease [Fundicoccus culcitae]
MDTVSKRNSLINRIPMLLIIAFILWFLVTFLFNPVFTIMKDTFWVDGQFTSDAVDKILRSNRALLAIRNSVVLALVLTVTINIVGIFIVLVTEYFDIKGAGILRIGFMTTLVFSGLVLNNGYLYVYGQNGVLTKLLLTINPDLNPQWFTGFPAVVFVMTFACTSNHMLFLRNAVRGLDNSVIEAAQNMGASQWHILKNVVMPMLKPVLFTLTIMAFQTGLGAMSAPLMVGGSFQTISPLILTFSQRPASRDIAALLSLILGVAQIALLIVMTYNEKKGNYLSISKTRTKLTKQKIQNPTINIIVHVIAYILFVIYTLPLILVILFSFMDTQGITQSTLSWEFFTLEHYQSVITDSGNLQPLLTSFTYSGLAAVGSVIFMLIVVRLIMTHRKNRFFEGMELSFYIPWLLPALLLVLGIILAYDEPSILLFGNLVVGTWWVLPVTYLIMMLPSTLRYLKSAYYSFDQNLEEASRILGASSARTFLQVILPALLSTALALVALNFNGYLADYDLSVFLYQPGRPTLGIAIRENAAPGSNVDAVAVNLVYSVLLMIISSSVLYFVYGRGSQVGERRSGFKKTSG